MRIGTKVIMVNCREAEKYEGRVWVTRSKPFMCCGKEVVLLEGKSGGFSTKCLKIVDEEEQRGGINMIFIAKGHAYVGFNKVDKDGNIIERKPGRFEEAPDGGSIAVGLMNSDTYKVEGDVCVFGDWQAAEICAKVLELLAPTRPANIPDFSNIIRKAYADGADICEYCDLSCDRCKYCIVNEWREEIEEDKQ